MPTHCTTCKSYNPRNNGVITYKEVRAPRQRRKITRIVWPTGTTGTVGLREEHTLCAICRGLSQFRKAELRTQGPMKLNVGGLHYCGSPAGGVGQRYEANEPTLLQYTGGQSNFRPNFPLPRSSPLLQPLVLHAEEAVLLV